MLLRRENTNFGMAPNSSTIIEGTCDRFVENTVLLGVRSC